MICSNRVIDNSASLKSSPLGQVGGEVLTKLDDAPILPVTDAVESSRMGEAHLEGGEQNLKKVCSNKKRSRQTSNI